MEAGKFWGVAYDLWNTGCEAGCLPTYTDITRAVASAAAAGVGSGNVGTGGADGAAGVARGGEGAWQTHCTKDPAFAAALASALGVFSGRYDHVCYTTQSGLVPVAVRRPCAPDQLTVPCPNSVAASDHLPLAVAFEIHGVARSEPGGAPGLRAPTHSTVTTTCTTTPAPGLTLHRDVFSAAQQHDVVRWVRGSEAFSAVASASSTLPAANSRTCCSRLASHRVKRMCGAVAGQRMPHTAPCASYKTHTPLQPSATYCTV